jgi:hypothetical protein
VARAVALVAEVVAAVRAFAYGGTIGMAAGVVFAVLASFTAALVIAYGYGIWNPAWLSDREVDRS